MHSKAQKIRLGIFLSVSLSVLILLLMVVIGSQFFVQRDNYFIVFRNTSISGLEVGAPVKYLGVRVGRIEKIDIKLDKNPRVIIEITIEGDIPIKKDVKASISMVGITGLKQIELQGGSGQSERLKPGGYIESTASFSQAVTGKAEVIANKMEKFLNNLLEFTSGENKQKFLSMVDNLSGTLATANRLMVKNEDSLSATMANMEKSTASLNKLLESTDKTMVSLNKLIQKYNNVSEALKKKKLLAILKNLNKTLVKANKTFTHIDLTVVKSRKDVIRSMELMRQSMQNINEVSRMLTEDPSLLLRGVEGQKRRR